ncbi:hypothetical protein L4A43_22370 [Salmonella enterica subsp. diarizonae serovar 16:z10:e,n,x,z15]|uniref:hypothetical protein n=1 Tax=Salmonella enterica TaxID=28901 RepID=UPI001D2C5E4E|nr:hypothetical protein [Salmonella enterica]MCH5484442.1 hypothetical protein [Salmonella enterica subsp. diarizonae serovar 16:z10:e,n,x,z15]
MMSRSSSFFGASAGGAAREQRCLWSVSRVRPGTGRAAFPLPAGAVAIMRPPLAF